MARSVIWTDLAKTDLEDIAAYIGRDSTHYAAAFVREVIEAARSLTELSERGRIVPELSNSDIRELVVRSYRLVYQVSQETVCIIAFIHGARGLRTLWQNRSD